jgi:hypothetical protein
MAAIAHAIPRHTFGGIQALSPTAKFQVIAGFLILDFN